MTGRVADAWGRLGAVRDLEAPRDSDDNKEHKARRGTLADCRRMLLRICAARTPPILLPVKRGKRRRGGLAGVPWSVVALAIVAALAVVTFTTVLALEVYGRLRFRGYFIDGGGSNGQLGFYHEMDIDMQALADAAGRPGARLFPANAVSPRELKAWVAERRRRTNERKYAVGCSLDASPLFDALLQQDGGWEELGTRDPADLFFKIDRKRAPSALLFCIHGPQETSNQPALDLFLRHNAYFRQLRALGALILVWSDDLRHFNQLNPFVLREQVFKQADVLVGPYAYAMDEFLASVSTPVDPRDLPIVLWLPQAAGSEFVAASLNTLPVNKILLPGSVETTSPSSPLRRWLSEFQAAHPRIMDAVSHHTTPTDRAAYMRSYRATITTTLQFQYLLPELFEIAATGSLLVVNRDAAPLLAALGLHESEHFVGFDRSNPAPTIQWVADPEHRQEVDAVRSAGMQAVREHHQATNRQVALETFVSDGVIAYQYSAGGQVPSACPSAGAASDAACFALVARDAHYRCDRWLCGFLSVLPRRWRWSWWP